MIYGKETKFKCIHCGEMVEYLDTLNHECHKPANAVMQKKELEK